MSVKAKKSLIIIQHIVFPAMLEHYVTKNCLRMKLAWIKQIMLHALCDYAQMTGESVSKESEKMLQQIFGK